jgi:trehalose 6-phosphate phosphatase
MPNDSHTLITPDPGPADTPDAPLPAVFADIAADPGRWALFLDIDGTLLDLAETPDAIVVPPDLISNLMTVSNRMGGALALVTGRALHYADVLFDPARFPIAGLHGAELRDQAGTITRPEITPEFVTLKSELARTAEAWEGVLFEDKGAAAALHYRLAPERQADVEHVMRRASVAIGGAWGLQFGKMVVELRPATASKGAAITTFLSQAPFDNRRPVAIGDDVTDEAMFKVANAAGGISLRVGEPGAETQAQASIGSAAEVRAALARLATRLERGART